MQPHRRSWARGPGALRGANVLLITIDTLRQDRVGAYGNRSGLTPNIDRIAARGVRYAHAFSPVAADAAGARVDPDRPAAARGTASTATRGSASTNGVPTLATRR